MMVFTGTTLFALLFAHACCFPSKTGFNPGASYGGGHASTGSEAGGSEGVSKTGSADPAVQEASASIVGYTSSGNAASPNPSNFVVSGSGFQQGPQDVDWAIQPLSLLSGNDGYATSEAVSPAYGSYGGSGPVYQGGDLSGYEGSYEHGDAMSETGGHGYVSPSPMMQEAALQQYTSHIGSGSGSDMAGIWGIHPLYDFMFMTGQYPPGTITHSARSYEQGRDNFADVHYQRYYIPQYTVQEIEIQAPQSPKVVSAKGKGKGF